MTTLESQVNQGGLFQGYAYGYPHKMAYRALSPSVPLADVWGNESKDSLFLYVHVPFCRVRCGFCNLFTTTGPDAAPNQVTRYLDALERQFDTVRDALGSTAKVSRIAIGGGTPSFLTILELERLVGLVSDFEKASVEVPFALEMSPDTVDQEKLDFLRERGVTRASLGVQSFVEKDTRSLGRPQRPETVQKALGEIRSAGFPIRNIDLIYGVEGQSLADWIVSLEAAVRHEPEEIFLYPLYVRPLTGLGRKDKRPIDAREDYYRHGRDYLLSHGYSQVSMRLFRSADHPGDCDSHYCCQEDGMVGMGAGARSYTAALHYSTEWAVGRTSVQEILHHFCGLPDHSLANYGASLNREEQERRYIIKSVLRSAGLDLAAYRSRFGTEAMEDFPMLGELVETGAGVKTPTHLKPTQLGLEWSDVIGPWLYSEQVTAAVNAFDLR